MGYYGQEGREQKQIQVTFQRLSVHIHRDAIHRDSMCQDLDPITGQRFAVVRRCGRSGVGGLVARETCILHPG